jgi:hypothetical protein
MDTQEQKFPITGKEGAEISINEATEWTKHHRHRHSPGSSPVSHLFGAEIVSKLLSHPDCQGIRIYHANAHPLTGWQRFCTSIGNFFIHTLANAGGEKHVILTAVTKHGHDMIPNGSTIADQDPATITFLAQQSVPCPGAPGCPQNVLTGE